MDRAGPDPPRNRGRGGPRAPVKLTDFFERIAFLWPWLLVAAGVWLVISALRRRAAIRDR